MSQFRVSPEAQQDLDAIYDYVADEQQALSGANRVLDEFLEKFILLASQPYMGTSCDDLQDQIPDLRQFRSGSYVVYYRPIPDGVEIIHVAHSARDRDAVFREWFGE